MREQKKRFYLENPQRTHVLDTATLLQEGLEALVHDVSFAHLLLVDPKNSDIDVTARIRITFPDDELLAPARDDEKLRAELLARQQQRVIAAWHGLAGQLRARFNQRVDDPQRELDFSTRSGTVKGDYMAEIMEISTAYKDRQNYTLLEQALRRVFDLQQLQMCKEVGLKITVHGSVNRFDVSGPVFDGVAPQKPISEWLQLDKKDIVVKFFSIPRVAEAIATACDGFKVGTDQAFQGAESRKRWNVKKDVPIAITSPADVLPLVQDMGLFAFYPAIVRRDGSVGRAVVDLDAQKGLLSLVGPQRAWEFTCGVSDAIVAAGAELGFPPPARHYSGSRGLHVVWDIVPDALAPDTTGVIGMDQYLNVVKVAEEAAKSNKIEKFMIREQTYAAKILMQGLVLRAMFTALPKESLDERERGMLGISWAHQGCTLGSSDPGAWTKIVADTQPTCYRWLSPHHNSGRITIPLVDAKGEIRKEFRKLENVVDAANIERVIADIANRPERYEECPGVITRDMLEWACEPGVLGADMVMVICDGVVAPCNASPDWYAARREKYIAMLMKEKKDSE
nr:hypothetical protein [Candidatus Sigynarchaeota archaeon]